jgi:dTDP-4-dehydrorhamnose 3,5-epimerase
MAYTIYEGLKHTDARGYVNSYNSLNLAEIVRMYEISPISTELIRGWQGHQHEKKWFHCSSGSFILNLIAIDNFESPTADLTPIKFILESEKPKVLEISGGYVTGIKANEKNSTLTVFSNYSLDASKNDDFRFPIDLWSFKH